MPAFPSPRTPPAPRSARPRPVGSSHPRRRRPAHPGQAGAATLRYTQAANYPDCSVTPAAGFRIYPPEDTASLFVAQPRSACSNAGPTLLTISAFAAK